MKKLFTSTLLILFALSIFSQSTYKGEADSIAANSDGKLSVVYLKKKSGIWDNDNKEFVLPIGKHFCFAFKSANGIAVVTPKSEKIDIFSYDYTNNNVTNKSFPIKEKLVFNLLEEVETGETNLVLTNYKSFYDLGFNQIYDAYGIYSGQVGIEKINDHVLFTDYTFPRYVEFPLISEVTYLDSVDANGNSIFIRDTIDAITNSTVVNLKSLQVESQNYYSTSTLGNYLFQSKLNNGSIAFDVIELDKGYTKVGEIHKNSPSFINDLNLFDNVQSVDSNFAIVFNDNKKGLLYFSLFNEQLENHIPQIQLIEKTNHEFIYFSPISKLVLTYDSAKFNLKRVDPFFNEYSPSIQFDNEIQIETMSNESSDELKQTRDQQIDTSSFLTEYIPLNYSFEVALIKNYVVINDAINENFQLYQTFDEVYGEPIINDLGELIFDTVFEPINYNSNVYDLTTNQSYFSNNHYTIQPLTEDVFLASTPELNAYGRVTEFTYFNKNLLNNKGFKLSSKEIENKIGLAKSFGHSNSSVFSYITIWSNGEVVDLNYNLFSIQFNNKMQLFSLDKFDNKHNDLIKVRTLSLPVDFIYRNTSFDYTIIENNDSISMIYDTKELINIPTNDVQKMYIYPHLDYSYLMGLTLEVVKKDNSILTISTDNSLNKSSLSIKNKGEIFLDSNRIIINQLELDNEISLMEQFDSELDAFYTTNYKWDNNNSSLWIKENNNWYPKISSKAIVQPTTFGYLVAEPAMEYLLQYEQEDYWDNNVYLGSARTYQFFDQQLKPIQYLDTPTFNEVTIIPEGFIVYKKKNACFFIDQKGNVYGEQLFEDFKIENQHVIGIKNEILKFDEFYIPEIDPNTGDVIYLQEYEEVDLGVLQK